MTKLDDYLAIFRVSTQIKIGETEFNEILMRIIPHSYVRQDFLQSFYFEAGLKKPINMFEMI